MFFDLLSFGFELKEKAFWFGIFLIRNSEKEGRALFCFEKIDHYHRLDFLFFKFEFIKMKYL